MASNKHFPLFAPLEQLAGIPDEGRVNILTSKGHSRFQGIFLLSHFAQSPHLSRDERGDHLDYGLLLIVICLL